jgi:flagellum-specific ATP synthase
MIPMPSYRAVMARTELGQRIGWVRRMQGLAIVSEGPDADIGEMCRVVPRTAAAGSSVLAEVVGIEPGHLVLMPYGSLEGVGSGARVVALGGGADVAVGADLLGRVVDAFGQPLDGKPSPTPAARWPLKAPGPAPLQRPRISRVLETGIRAIDGLLTIGEGQRMGIFAGSGVGKSTLLGMLTRQAKVDVNVVALIGERGREVREFIEEQLGSEGLARSVVVVATSEQPALARIRAAHAAGAIAAYFREQGRSVLLTMDSITRLAMARREVGLAAGEPATARGYTPSVFAELPQICERCGTSPSGGSTTALLTVLVEGDDLNEPVADSMRSFLDGHIVLSRELAQQGHYPPIDVLRSGSRLLPDLANDHDRALVAGAVRHLAVLEKSRDLVDLGAYVPGSNAALDTALALEAPLYAWLRQDRSRTSRAEALQRLGQILDARKAP